ncbi:MAG: HAD family hydrolase [Thermomicrobiales bacterium]
MQPLDPQPDLIVFDLDDTLCDYASARWLRLRIAFDRAIGLLPRRPPIDLDQLAAESIAMHPHGVDHFDELLGRYGVSSREGIASAKEWYRVNRFHGLRLFDDALETLSFIRSAMPERRVGMITNGPAETQQAKIDLLGIRAYFDFIVVSGEFGVAKPEKPIFDEALRLGDATPDRAIHIGDSAEFDIAGARNAGVTAIWMNHSGAAWPLPAPPPDHQVRSLTEVRRLLAADHE